MKRKLRTSDSAWEQFQTLQQVKGLSHAQGREIVQLLREDDTGHATCRTNNLKYPNARPLAATVTHATDAHTLRVHLNSLPDVVQAKVERCPLYAKLLEDAVHRTHGRLTLVLFADEAQPGNQLECSPSAEVELDLLLIFRTRDFVSGKHVASFVQHKSSRDYRTWLDN